MNVDDTGRDERMISCCGWENVNNDDDGDENYDDYDDNDNVDDILSNLAGC